ncbi:hypothetical protein NDU88_000825 [Pleurodeles waltl]|uniref:Uncharacterized protein n=1 Tax=Pleurodeles waltl TaxID=8319 RepID=A0AAV7V803_PLEWA|nr:hypothetical protein NDU88_000825 [Pleurodeles waltl]
MACSRGAGQLSYPENRNQRSEPSERGATLLLPRDGAQRRGSSGRHTCGLKAPLSVCTEVRLLGHALLPLQRRVERIRLRPTKMPVVNTNRDLRPRPGTQYLRGLPTGGHRAGGARCLPAGAAGRWAPSRGRSPPPRSCRTVPGSADGCLRAAGLTGACWGSQAFMGCPGPPQDGNANTQPDKHTQWFRKESDLS